jgi:Holliday junction resolvase RusA-like endonuclease
MRIFIPGKAKGKGRPRFYNGHAVTPQDTRDYETLIAMTWKAYKGGYYEGCPLRIDITVNVLVPISRKKKERLDIARGKLKPTMKPDVDNIAKIVLDGLNGVAYKDDKQVTELRVRKQYTFSASREGVLIEVKEDKYGT